MSLASKPSKPFPARASKPCKPPSNSSPLALNPDSSSAALPCSPSTGTLTSQSRQPAARRDAGSAAAVETAAHTLKGRGCLAAHCTRPASQSARRVAVAWSYSTATQQHSSRQQTAGRSGLHCDTLRNTSALQAQVVCRAKPQAGPCSFHPSATNTSHVRQLHLPMPPTADRQL